MGIMGYLRERMGKIVAIVIGLSLFAFIASEAVRSGGSFFRDDTNELGNVGGEKIAYDEYQKEVDQNSAQFKQAGQAISPQILNYVQENTWGMMVNRVVLKKEIEKLGLVVSNDETQSMISGSNPDPQVVQQFTDPQTGKFSRERLAQIKQAISQLKDGDPQKARWNEFVNNLIDSKLSEKYMAMVTGGLYVNSLEATDDYEAKNKLANFKYALLEYASIPDNKVTLTDADYNEYYNEHKGEYKNRQEVRDIRYVSFNGAPSKDDSAKIKADIEKLIPEFKASKNDSLFVQLNAETKTPLIYTKKGRLDPKIDSIMFGAPVGTVYGPYVSNGSYDIAKLVDARVGPDSVKARHILIDPTTAGGVDKALAKADSLKKVIQSGKASFAALANIYSVDKTSAVKGGDLGTFGRGAMIPVFDDAVFNGKKGEIKIVTSQYGVHLIEIQDQKGSSKVVKVAVVDKPLSASSTTQAAAYSKAQAFLGALNKTNFDDEAKKAGVKTQTADNIPGSATAVNGLDNARELVRWVYKADANDISDQVFTVGDKYIVAQVTMVKKKGILPLEAVKKQIEPMVRNYVKGKMLTDKFNSALAGASNIDQVAQKAGSKVTPIQNVVFANPMIPGAALEYKVVGAVFGSPVNKLSKAIAGQQGVYVFTVDGFTNPPALTNAVREKQQIGQIVLQRSQGQILEALKDKDNVKDYRAKFL